MTMIAMPQLILLLASALLPSLLEASASRTPQREVVGAADSAQARHRLMQEKLISEFNAFKKDHHPGGTMFKRSRHLQEDEEEPEQEEEEGRTIIVECSQKAVFMCSDCATMVQEEQDSVWQDILSLYPGAELVSSSQRLVNALFVKFPLPNDEEALALDNALRQVEGVEQVTLHGNLDMEIFPAVEYMGGYRAQEQSCASGRDVRVAVLDGGIDYTHKYLGGEGTEEAYAEAYGRGPRSPQNRRRDDLFPTEVVVDGYDFIGEYSGVAIADDDPIDSFGHGTAVSHAILTISPNAKLVGLKVCGSRSMSCPVWAIIRGLEYALDPNGDDDIEDKVDIVNLSLGIAFVSPFYNFVAAALERIFELGVLPVVSAGNSGNVPFVIGGLSGSPNSISVGATGHPSDRENVGVMANYSSRGPGENNMMKPDIVAPSGLTLAAAGTGIYRYRGIQGTSFSAPLVAGAAALVMDRCPECSPFAVKALLMNNANRTTRYNSSSPALSPITLSGAGEMIIDKALEADVWAYSVEDSQPSISLGLIDAASDVVIERTIKLINLSGNSQALRVSYQMRNPQHPYAEALRVDFSTPRVLLSAGCNSEATVTVTFTIVAARAPPNHMTSAGREGFDPRKLDIQEFGGHVVFESVGTTPKDISVPFVSIIRSASDMIAGNPVLSDLNDKGATTVRVDLSNQGAGNAQVDAFQLLVASGDDPESSFGESVIPNDFRYIGYRVLEVGREGCTHLVEFAINTWERKNGRLVTQLYGVDIDLDDDNDGDRFLFNSGLARENYVSDLRSGDTYCTGMPPDHGTSSTNTILRACSEELGIADFEGQIGVRFEAVTFTQEGFMVRTDASGRDDDFIRIDFPRPGLSTPSFDLVGGDTLQNIQVYGVGVGTSGSGPVGLMLVTNSFRTPSSTGAATPSSETLILLREGFDAERLPSEITPDLLLLPFPVAQDLTGPQCPAWKTVDSPCDTTGLVGNPNAAETADDEDETLESPLENEDSMLNPNLPQMTGMIGLAQRQREDGAIIVTTCPKRDVPRANVSPPAAGGGGGSSVPVNRDAAKSTSANTDSASLVVTTQTPPSNFGDDSADPSTSTSSSHSSISSGIHDSTTIWEAANLDKQSSSSGTGTRFGLTSIMLSLLLVANWTL